MPTGTSYRELAERIIEQWRISIEIVQKGNVRSLMTETQLLPYMIPRASGGWWPVNRECYVAISDFGKKWRLESCSTLRNRIAENDATKLAHSVFSELPDGTDDAGDQPNLAEGLLNRLNDISDTWPTISFYIPCAITQHPAPTQLESFSLGPVTFQRKDAWASALLRAAGTVPNWVRSLVRHLQGSEQQTELSPDEKNHVEDTLRHIGNCAWIAQVDVHSCHENMAREKAKLVVALALDAVGATLLDRHWRDLAANKTLGEATTSFELYGKSDGSLSVRWNKEWHGYNWADVEFKEWIERNSKFFEAAGIAIGRALSPNSEKAPQAPAARWLDALYAFGEARRSKSPAIAIVNYGIALDTLTNGGKATRIIDLLSSMFGKEKGDALLRDGTTLREFVEQLYNAGRSRYSHGTSSLLFDEPPISLSTASHVVTIVLINCIILLKKSNWLHSISDFETWLKARPLST